MLSSPTSSASTCSWPVEHHFSDYSFCPDNTVFLAYMAARTEADPARHRRRHPAVERAVAGSREDRVCSTTCPAAGCCSAWAAALSRCEYERLRHRDGRVARPVRRGGADGRSALETGWIEGDGPYFPQPAADPTGAVASFRDRTFCVAMSPDSVEAAADLGARMVMFSQRPWDDQAASVRTYRDRFVGAHGTEPGPPVICDFVYCDRDAVAPRRWRTNTSPATSGA